MWQGIKNVYHLAFAILATLFFGYPSKKTTVVGVTGTDGKTTTTSLIYHILKSSGRHVSMISSIEAIINGKTYDTGFHVTTPSSWMMQKLLKKSLDKSEGKKYMILEVTSHAIDQYRIWGIDFEIACLTNITEEHLDYHKTYDNYAETKLKLLAKAKYGVVNKDDRSYAKVLAKFGARKVDLMTYGFKGDADITLESFRFQTRLIGDFNKYNILAAAAVARKLGLPDREIRKAVETFTLPKGRTEIVYENDFVIMVDFAHTSNALKQILSSLKKKVSGRLIHVFGSAGERDRQKRPKMGEVSAIFSDVIIVTSEDPRSESAEKIIEDILGGIKDSEKRIREKKLYKISDRQEAIEKAVLLAKKGDLVLITGKGHEKSMNYNGIEKPWDEFKSVRIALSKREK